MKLKTGIKISDLNSAVVLAAVVADGVYRELGVSTGVTVTSGTDGDHSERSLHYTSNTPDGKGRALDLRVWDLPTEEDRQVAVRKLRERLTSDFDVVLEPTHIHLEYDPK